MAIPSFRQRIRKSLCNPVLQAALDANADRRLRARLTAFASLPDWRARRQRAHAIRADIVDHLDEYTEKFVHKVQANGIQVHRAHDASAAIDIILQIIHEKGGCRNSIDASANPQPSLVAKAKSMVSEEINLNHALEAEGIKVVETDLGEYIVQLRGERPSHIITPAVHLRRQEVGRLFEEKLGIPYTEDIPTLTNTARKVLREVFLAADVGLSGVNFGVVETGTLCIVTNEGNGRMVTTLPPVHIALMGMERLLATLDDLALLLSLLPRSATGQKLSVYTQFLHKPLSGQQRHLVILDNGRSALRASPLAESLYCIRCGACLNACPVFRELGGHAYASVYPGPIGSVISAGLFGSEFVPLAQASTLCGACKEACPVDIDLPKLLIRVRSGLSPDPSARSGADILETETYKNSVTHRTGTGSLSLRSKFILKIYSHIARIPSLFNLAARFTALTTHILSPSNGWLKLPSLSGWGYSRDFPRFAAKPFRSLWDQEITNGFSTGAADSHAGTRSTDSSVTVSQIRERSVQGTLKDQFMVELTAVNGQVILSTQKDLAAHLISWLKSRQIQRVQLETDLLDDTELARANIEVVKVPDPGIKVGITSAVCGLADTGSILVMDGADGSLPASLLTESHIAILKTSAILPSLAEAVHLQSLRNSRSAVFITGPSRTGDIEMSHTIGVHGPGELLVCIVDG